MWRQGNPYAVLVEVYILSDTVENSMENSQKIKNCAIIYDQMGKQWKQCQSLFFGAPKSLQMMIEAMKLKDAYSLEGNL